MSLNTFVTCDCCNEEVLPDDAPHQTRGEFDHVKTEHRGKLIVPMVEALPRRDLCATCMTRIHQTINTYLPNCHWLLEGFEVAE